MFGARFFASGFRPHGQGEEPAEPTFANKKGVGQGPYTRVRTGPDDGKFRPQLNPIDFVTSRPVKSPRASPKLKEELRKTMPAYMQSAAKEIDAAFDEAERAVERVPDSSHPLTYK